MDIRAKKECLFIRDLISLSKKFFRLEEAIRKGVLELYETLNYKKADLLKYSFCFE